MGGISHNLPKLTIADKLVSRLPENGWGSSRHSSAPSRNALHSSGPLFPTASCLFLLCDCSRVLWEMIFSLGFWMNMSISIYTELNQVPLDCDISLISTRLYPLEQLNLNVTGSKVPTTSSRSHHIQMKTLMNN